MCEMLPRGLLLVALPLTRLNGYIQRIDPTEDPTDGSGERVVRRRCQLAARRGPPAPLQGSSHEGDPRRGARTEGLARVGGRGETEGT